MAGPRGCAVRQFLRIAFPKEVSARHLQQVGSELQGLVSCKIIHAALPNDDIIIPQSREESQSRIENARIVAREHTMIWRYRAEAGKPPGARFARVAFASTEGRERHGDTEISLNALRASQPPLLPLPVLFAFQSGHCPATF